LLNIRKTTHGARPRCGAPSMSRSAAGATILIPIGSAERPDVVVALNRWTRRTASGPRLRIGRYSYRHHVSTKHSATETKTLFFGSCLRATESTLPCSSFMGNYADQCSKPLPPQPDVLRPLIACVAYLPSWSPYPILNILGIHSVLHSSFLCQFFLCTKRLCDHTRV
jgi:hypothetical protein